MFQKNNIICFLGDSITANGMWMAEIYQTLRKTVPIKCYNCGVSGATAEQATKYLHSRCLVHNPDYVVMMYGINDIWMGHYAPEFCDDPDMQKQKREAMERHKENYEKLVQETVAFGAKVILCIAVPYDEVSDVAQKNMYCQCGMDESSVFVRELAEKYDCKIVDFKQTMQPMLGKRNIMREDRVHPTEEGHHIMAQTFLADLGIIDAPDFDAPFLWEDWNKERYEAEQMLSSVNYVEFCVLWEETFIQKMSFAERKEIVKAHAAEGSDNPYIATAYQEYLEKTDFRMQLMGEIVKKTIF